MNDLEDKLRGLPFCELPTDLRRNVLAAAGSAAKEAAQGELSAWTWRDWLWPSPLAWAALAVLLAGSLAVDGLMTEPPERTRTVAAQPAEAPSVGIPAFQPRDREVALSKILP